MVLLNSIPSISVNNPRQKCRFGGACHNCATLTSDMTPRRVSDHTPRRVVQGTSTVVTRAVRQLVPCMTSICRSSFTVAVLFFCLGKYTACKALKQEVDNGNVLTVASGKLVSMLLVQ